MQRSVTHYAQLPPQCLALAASAPGRVLLHTARPDEENYRSYLFLAPAKVLAAGEQLFEQIESALAGGAYVAGFLSYECGEGLRNLRAGESGEMPTPLAWFGVYPEPIVFNHRTGEFEGAAPGDGLLSSAEKVAQNFEICNPRLTIDEQSYAQKVAAIQEYIRSGETYQVNFTDRLEFDFSGSPEEMFRALGESQPVAYSAFLRGEDWHVLSLSPELFFCVKERRIRTRPMKGTARRGRDGAEDEAIARWLHNDPKNRSENVMIVDLLRNDLGRICEYGSVRAEHLFSVESYETLFQLTSQVSGTLREDVGYEQVFASLFPCGSVTGAPKHRTLEIIRTVERGARGVYTGAIGFFSPHKEAVFSVPIRTVVLQDGRGTMGVGSGIVIDSNATQEYRECQLKAEFLTRREPPFELIESILWDGGYQRLSAHLERLQASAGYFGFAISRAAVIAALEEHSKQLQQRSKVRVLLARSGTITITHSPIEPQQQAIGEVIVSECRVCSEDRFLRHKTTRRELYDQQYAQARERGYDEVLFLNERGEVTEGAISNVFIEQNGRWLTTPVACGLLPGVYRSHLLISKRASEQVLHLEDLLSADAVYICNAVRGCRRVTVKVEESRRALLRVDHAPSVR